MLFENIIDMVINGYEVSKVLYRGVVLWPPEGVLIIDKPVLLLNSENDYTDHFNVITSAETQWTFE